MLNYSIDDRIERVRKVSVRDFTAVFHAIGVRIMFAGWGLSECFRCQRFRLVSDHGRGWPEGREVLDRYLVSPTTLLNQSPISLISFAEA